MSLHHLGRLQLDSFRQRFSERDVAILTSLREHRFLTGQQIMRLHFHDHASTYAGARACSRVMERLQRLHTVARIQRRVGGPGGGSTSQVWTLDFNGYRLTERPHKTGRRRQIDPSITFLNHTLAVAETRVRIEEITRRRPIVLTNLEIEVTAWRTFTGGAGQPVSLRPDLAVTLTDDEFEDGWFIEVDLDTESVRAVLSKCSVYDQYRRSGREQVLRGVFPRVLWLVPTRPRADALIRAIAASSDLHPRLFTVAVFEELEAALLNETTDYRKEVQQ
ncbi:replication-relaxation family protein [Plantibacter sp. CFBP 8798]|uniref:replication-relaxation family protein n=1 Tax=Plantibacter sp. CFBP 8798 TaxID=2775268 RepID=UPI001782B3C8|nr:replication-relaxation family protein [Plantibacter sp. CFBP 8798]MBD8467091.1 replication-relaxation family protein [Plantibacter sp. CFBP 8798]